MIDAEISLNGIDPDGENPPDEILYHPDEGRRVELVRQGRTDADDWRLVVYADGEGQTSRPVGDDFGAAFALFASQVEQERGAVA